MCPDISDFSDHIKINPAEDPHFGLRSKAADFSKNIQNV